MSQARKRAKVSLHTSAQTTNEHSPCGKLGHSPHSVRLKRKLHHHLARWYQSLFRRRYSNQREPPPRKAVVSRETNGCLADFRPHRSKLFPWVRIASGVLLGSGRDNTAGLPFGLH
jgi:hypothetical protein